MLFVVDILKSESKLILESDYEKEIAEKAFEKSVDGNVMDLPGVVSRKKQMVPNVEKVV
jgi:manganese-dependent inorganic pyrophosphatase